MKFTSDTHSGILRGYGDSYGVDLNVTQNTEPGSDEAECGCLETNGFPAVFLIPWRRLLSYRLMFDNVGKQLLTGPLNLFQINLSLLSFQKTKTVIDRLRQSSSHPEA